MTINELLSFESIRRIDGHRPKMASYVCTGLMPAVNGWGQNITVPVEKRRDLPIDGPWRCRICGAVNDNVDVCNCVVVYEAEHSKKVI